MSFLRLASIAVLCAIPSLAIAGDSTHRIDARQDQQAARIRAGVADGELNYRETRRLVHGQLRVNRIENRAVADNGVVGPAERARIEHAQNVQSHRIFRQKHDRQGRR